MDLSKLPDSQRQELEKLHKQFQEHQAQQQKQQEQSAAAVQQPPPSAYDPFHAHQPYHPSQAYDHSYIYNYQDPSRHHQQQSHQHYDASYYQNYYSNSYQQQHYTHSETILATAYAASYEQQRNLGLGQVQDPYANMGNRGNLGGAQPNPGYPGPPGLNPTAAAAVAALTHLTQFAGSIAAVEHHNQGHFRLQAGHPPYRGGGRRGGGPFRGDGHGNSGFRQPNTGTSGPPFSARGPARGRGRGRGRDRGPRRHGLPVGSPSSKPESSKQPRPRIAWCEVCRVDCTHVEMLQQHNNGRRHKKNLRLLQQKKSADPPVDQSAGQTADAPAGQTADPPVDQTADQPVVQTKEDPKPASDIGPELQNSTPENKPDEQLKVVDDNNINNNNNTAETKENENHEKKPRMKRKMRDHVRGTRGTRGSRGRRDGAKRMRPNMRPTGPRQIKVVIPLMCDLCNIKCDTQEVFNKHAGGKRHMAKLKRFQNHQAMYGATAVQALYPPNPLSQTLGPQPAYYGESSAPHEAYVPTPYQAPNPQLADAPLEFGTQTHATNGV